MQYVGSIKNNMNSAKDTDHINQSRTEVTLSSGTSKSLIWPLFTGPSAWQNNVIRYNWNSKNNKECWMQIWSFINKVALVFNSVKKLWKLLINTH